MPEGGQRGGHRVQQSRNVVGAHLQHRGRLRRAVDHQHLGRRGRARGGPASPAWPAGPRRPGCRPAPGPGPPAGWPRPARHRTAGPPSRPAAPVPSTVRTAAVRTVSRCRVSTAAEAASRPGRSGAAMVTRSAPGICSMTIPTPPRVDQLPFDLGDRGRLGRLLPGQRAAHPGDQVTDLPGPPGGPGGRAGRPGVRLGQRVQQLEGGHVTDRVDDRRRSVAGSSGSRRDAVSPQQQVVPDQRADHRDVLGRHPHPAQPRHDEIRAGHD